MPSSTNLRAGLLAAFALAAAAPASAYDRRDEPSILRHQQQLREQQRRYERQHQPRGRSSPGNDADLFLFGLGAMLGAGALQQGLSLPPQPPYAGYNRQVPFDPIATPMAQACPGRWKTDRCLDIVAAASGALAQSFGATLEQAGQPGLAAQVRAICGEASVPSRDAVGMVTNFRACYDSAFDASMQSGVKPDTLRYNMVSGPLVCLAERPQCGQFTSALREFLPR